MDSPQRKKQRLFDFDYASERYYFVTICTKDRQPFLSKIVGNGGPSAAGFDRSVKLLYSRAGKACVQHLRNIPIHFPDVTVDKFVVMPNHIHLIIVIGCAENPERTNPFPTLSTVIGQYKAGVSKELGVSIWQKSFYDHIIRGKEDYREIWEYIEQNPLKWAQDEYNDG